MKLSGKQLLITSVITRAGVLLLLVLFALWTEYLNLKVGYNHPRLVGLAHGPVMQQFYEMSDAFFSLFGDPVQVMQTNGGMTWSIRIMGVPFTDPVAALSYGSRNFSLPLGFALGLTIPLAIALTCGRVFCAYICPASLLFFFIGRLRRFLKRFLWFPEVELNRGFAWGLLSGGLISAFFFGYGVWTLLLPYFAIGHTIFHGLAFGILSSSVVSLVVFSVIDFICGQNFTCRYVCPTGRLLGAIGSKSLVRVNREASDCVSSCTACTAICPLKVDPKTDQSHDCSLCGECLAVCPSKCLTIGRRKK